MAAADGMFSLVSPAWDDEQHDRDEYGDQQYHVSPRPDDSAGCAAGGAGAGRRPGPAARVVAGRRHSAGAGGRLGPPLAPPAGLAALGRGWLSRGLGERRLHFLLGQDRGRSAGDDRSPSACRRLQIAYPDRFSVLDDLDALRVQFSLGVPAVSSS